MIDTVVLANNGHFDRRLSTKMTVIQNNDQAKLWLLQIVYKWIRWIAVILVPFLNNGLLMIENGHFSGLGNGHFGNGPFDRKIGIFSPATEILVRNNGHFT